MAHIDPELQKVLEDLKTQRDELRVRLHLAKAEAMDEWERLEHTWEHVRGRMEVVGHEAGKTAKDVGAALRLRMLVAGTSNPAGHIHRRAAHCWF